MASLIDHLVYATAELATTVAELESRLGVSLTPGGQHVGRGTRNYLAGLGSGAYLEVIGPDPTQPQPPEPRPFGVDQLTSPRLLTWAARVSDLAGAVSRARAAGYDPGPVVAMSRRRSDGVLLEWELTVPGGESENGLVPFLIDWGASPHPAADAVSGVELVSLTGVHPSPERVISKLAALDQSLPVSAGPVPGLRAVLRSASGDVVLS
jgi:hypothetical protein